MAETIQDTQFDQIFAVFSAAPNFPVPGLDPRTNDPDGLVGQIIFPTATVGGVLQLREDVVDASLGMPRDLDGIPGIDAADHSGDYILLPVRLRLQWQAVSGDRTLDLSLLLIDQ